MKTVSYTHLLANQLGEQASSETDAVARIYEYIKENIVYDYDKAAGDVTGYVPDPDQTLSSGKGICFDYASLAAAMLRSQGIQMCIRDSLSTAHSFR